MDSKNLIEQYNKGLEILDDIQYFKSRISTLEGNIKSLRGMFPEIEKEQKENIKKLNQRIKLLKIEHKELVRETTQNK